MKYLPDGLVLHGRGRVREGQALPPGVPSSERRHHGQARGGGQAPQRSTSDGGAAVEV